MSLDFWRAESLVLLPWLTHGVTHRTGGVSGGGYRSLNVGLHVGDSYSDVMENRQRVANALGFEVTNMICAEQIHRGEAAVVSYAEAGRGIADIADAIPGVDALITKTPGVLLALYFADCVPVLFADPMQQVIAVAHAGWRGIVAEVIENTVQKMNEQFDCQPETLLAAIGPCIGPESFEVGAEVASHFVDDCLTDYPKPHVDLPSAAKRRLTALGILPKNIQCSRECTVSNSDRYFSHRRDYGQTGRMAAVIGIRTQ